MIERARALRGSEGAARVELRHAHPVPAEAMPTRGDKVAVLVNSLGSTPLMELYIMNRRVQQRLDGLGVSVHATWVGNYCTSLEMAGASVTLMHLDGELQKMTDHPCDCAMFRVV